ncbi:sigma-70 family RNA polymerase sigma factor [Lentzea chajnantorensis]
MLSPTIVTPNSRAQSTTPQPKPATAAECSDREQDLIAAVRQGDRAAFGELYAEHVAAAYNLAYQLSYTDADDLVAEAFSKVLAMLLGGRGPEKFPFRAYLLRTLRNGHYDKFKRDKRITLSEDISGDADAAGMTVPFTDPAVAGLERSLASRAFASLTPRWQKVLWHTEIQQQDPIEVAPLLGLSPNAVAALACRARKGLRSAYLQMHVREEAAESCKDVVGLLGAWTRGETTKWETRRVDAHLDGCGHCRAITDELKEDNAGILC